MTLQIDLKTDTNQKYFVLDMSLQKACLQSRNSTAYIRFHGDVISGHNVTSSLKAPRVGKQVILPNFEAISRNSPGLEPDGSTSREIGVSENLRRWPGENQQNGHRVVDEL